jgi:condensin complex subunit 1
MHLHVYRCAILGSLDDHTLRLENTNPIFERLLEYIQRPCRAVDWFGMAEQAVNTIYALAEHPDRLCSTLIKKLTQQAFARKSAAPPTPAQDAMDTENGENNTNSPQDEDAPMPESTSQQTQMSGGAGGEMQDPGDAFELAQLLFIVGHVALKQHVYLELVEKEMKRQKDVGELFPLPLEIAEINHFGS